VIEYRAASSLDIFISKYHILLFIQKLSEAFGLISQIVHISFHLTIIDAVLPE
jgi:hypothetical protein